MGTLIDASVFIAAERGQLDVTRLAREDEDEHVAMAAITASELLHGVHRVKTAVGRTRAERVVERAISLFPVVSFDLDVARVHARLGAELAAAGAAVGAHDLVIAATAVWLNYRIATRDLRSFPKIRGLRVVRW